MSQMVAAAGACVPAGEANPNLLSNGSFVAHADGWYAWNTQAIAGSSFAAGQSREGGSGALSFPVSVGASLIYVDGAPIQPIGALTEYDLVMYAKSADTTADMSVNVDFFSDSSGVTTTDSHAYVTGALNGATWTVGEGRAIAVPVGTTHYQVRIELGAGDEATPIYVDDVYFGPSGGDDDPYAGAAVAGLTGNRIANSTYEVDTVGWDAWAGPETLLRDTVDPMSGLASFKITTPGGAAGQGIWTSGQNIVVVAGESLAFSMLARGSGTLEVIGDWDTADPSVIWTGAVPATEETVSDEVVVPAGAVGVMLQILTTTDQAVTFWIDDVSLGTP